MKTKSEIAKEFEIHPMMVGQWKNEPFEHMPELFAGKPDKDAHAKDKEKGEPGACRRWRWRV